MGQNTYDAIGNLDDLSPLITNIAPFDTPLMSALGTAPPATATFHEWLEDDLGSPGANAKIEGFTFTTSTPDTRERLGNYTQIMWRGYNVTGTQQVVKKAGVGEELSYHMPKAMKLIGLDVEKALIENSTRVQGNKTDTARQFGGVPFWVTTNLMDNSAVARPFTEAIFEDALEAVFDEGGNLGLCLLSIKNKRIVNGWNSDALVTTEASNTKGGRKIDTWEFEGGVIKFMVDRWMPNTSVFLLDPSLWGISYLRPFKTQPIPKTGDLDEEGILGELTLEARAEQANAIISDLSTGS